MKILLVLETKNDIRIEIVKNLEILGHDVYTIPNLGSNKITLFDKVINLILHIFNIKNNFIKDKKAKLEKQNKAEEINYVLKNEYDLTLIFRADIISDKDLELYKSLSKRFVAYQWDGVNRYEDFIRKIHFFDDVFCFDPTDENLPEIKFLPNFYFSNIIIPKQENVYDIIYIGYFYPNRLKILHKISEYYPNLKLHFILKSFDKKENKIIQESDFLVKINDVLSYNDLLIEQNKSKIVLDLKHDSHDGLSFRFFESMILGKKIITTNRSIKNYDFYDPTNIFILEEDNFSEISDFIKKEYCPVPQNIIDKYSFENWFKIVSDDEFKEEIMNPYSNEK